jgi:hypothetical protein
MTHLIAPINIDGNLYCLTRGGDEYTIGRGNWRTEAIIDGSIVETVGEDDWQHVSGNGSVKFVVSCVSQINIFAADNAGSGSADVEILLNGVIFDAGSLPGPALTFEIPIECRACGNILEIAISASGTIEIEFRVADVL